MAKTTSAAVSDQLTESSGNLDRKTLAGLLAQLPEQAAAKRAQLEKRRDAALAALEGSEYLRKRRALEAANVALQTADAQADNDAMRLRAQLQSMLTPDEEKRAYGLRRQLLSIIEELQMNLPERKVIIDKDPVKREAEAARTARRFTHQATAIKALAELCYAIDAVPITAAPMTTLRQIRDEKDRICRELADRMEASE